MVERRYTARHHVAGSSESRAQSTLTCIRLCYRCVNGPNGCGVTRRLGLLPDDCRFLENSDTITWTSMSAASLASSFSRRYKCRLPLLCGLVLSSEILAFHRPNAEQLNCRVYAFYRASASCPSVRLSVGIAVANIKLWHRTANIIKIYCYTLKQHLSPALKCFLLEFGCNSLVMNIN